MSVIGYLIVDVLLQTFYRNKIPDITKTVSRERSTSGDNEDHNIRDTDCREYLKEVLINNPLWREARFWEQALWQCVLEQVLLSFITI
jgi:hypothetical protein